MRSTFFLLLLASLLLIPSTQAQLQWSKQNFGGSFERTDRTDLNGDGFPDLLLYEQQDFIATQINSGSGTEAGGSLLEQHLDRVAFLDFNRDNKMDVAGCNSSENLVILLGNGDGTLTPSQTIGVPCSWVVAADFNPMGSPT
jgi:FG-GAP-like repeat